MLGTGLLCTRPAVKRALGPEPLNPKGEKNPIKTQSNSEGTGEPVTLKPGSPASPDNTGLGDTKPEFRVYRV